MMYLIIDNEDITISELYDIYTEQYKRW